MSNKVSPFIAIYGFTKPSQIDKIMTGIKSSVPIYFGIRIDDHYFGEKIRPRQALLDEWGDLITQRADVHSFIYLQSHEESDLIQDIEYIFAKCQRVPEMLLLCCDELHSHTLREIRTSYPKLIIGLDITEIDNLLGINMADWAEQISQQFAAYIDFYFVDQGNDSGMSFNLENITAYLQQLMYFGICGPYLISGGLNEFNVHRLRSLLQGRDDVSILAGRTMLDQYDELDEDRLNKFLQNALAIMTTKNSNQ